MKFTPNEIMEKLLHVLEYVICVIILIAVVAGLPDLFRYIWDFAKNPSSIISYRAFSDFLKHALMLVVGIELIYMIISHQNENILTLVLFVIARKMLVYAEGMLDILIGTVSIVLIFITLKFIVMKEYSIKKFDGTFSASVSLKDLKNEHNIVIDASENTLGGLVARLAGEAGKKPNEGDIYSYGGYDFSIKKMTEGVIDRILITKK